MSAARLTASRHGVRRRARVLAAVVVLCACVATRAEDNTSQLFDGVATNLAQDLFAGAGGTNNQLTVLNAAQLVSMSATVGGAVGADANAAVVRDTGSQWSVPGRFVVGDRALLNALAISNGGSVLSAELDIGFRAGAAFNVATVSGAGAFSSNTYGCFIGIRGSSNSMSIANGATLWARDTCVGERTNAVANVMLATGAGSWVTNLDSFTVGRQGREGLAVISAGARIVDTYGQVGVLAEAVSNSVIVEGPGSAWYSTADLNIGSAGSYNGMAVSNGGGVGAAVCVVGDFAAATGNWASISGSGSVWDARTALIIGRDGSAGALAVRDGALLTSPSGVVGQTTFAWGNSAEISGPGSLWTNAGMVLIGDRGGASSVLVTNSGRIVCGTAVVGNNATSAWNRVTLLADGARWDALGGLIVGRDGWSNCVRVGAGALLYTPTGTVGQSRSSASNCVILSGAGAVWTNAGELRVGDRGRTNAVVVETGGRLTSGLGQIGCESQSCANIVLLRGGAVWDAQGGVTVGRDGCSNRLVLETGALLVSSGGTVGQNTSASSNLIEVSGAGTIWTNTGLLAVGQNGRQNELVVRNGGQIRNRGIIEVSQSASSANNRITLSDAGSFIRCDDSLNVGDVGPNTVVLAANAAALVSSNATLGNFASATSCVVWLTGPGTVWTNLASMTVGNHGAGCAVVVSNGASLLSANCTVGGRDDGVSNRLVVCSPGSFFRTDTYLTLGPRGMGNLMLVTNGGVAQTGTDAFICEVSDSTGSAVVVTGSGSVWRVLSQTVVGRDGGQARLSILNGGCHDTRGMYIGQFAASGSNLVELTAGELAVTNSAGSAILRVLRGTLRLDSGRLRADRIFVDDQGVAVLSPSCDVTNAGAITCSGRLVATNDFTFPMNVTVQTNGVLNGEPGAQWTFERNLIVTSTNSMPDLQYLKLKFTAGKNHQLTMTGYNWSNTLAGLKANQAIGELIVEGTATVSGVVYAWALSGSGDLTVPPGARLYYGTSSNWTGTVHTSGGSVFDNVAFELDEIETEEDGSVELGWGSVPGLTFAVDWNDNLTNSLFNTATTFQSGASSETWNDTGDVSRLPPSAVPFRSYRLRVWP